MDKGFPIIPFPYPTRSKLHGSRERMLKDSFLKIRGLALSVMGFCCDDDQGGSGVRVFDKLHLVQEYIDEAVKKGFPIIPFPYPSFLLVKGHLEQKKKEEKNEETDPVAPLNLQQLIIIAKAMLEEEEDEVGQKRLSSVTVVMLDNFGGESVKN